MVLVFSDAKKYHFSESAERISAFKEKRKTSFKRMICGIVSFAQCIKDLMRKCVKTD